MHIGFGSCNRQNLPQQFWNNNIDNIDGFLWIGDAVYAANNSISGLEHAYQNLTNNAEYQRFREGLSWIDGVWDDHDYGVNDGGSHVKGKDERQRLFLDFLFGKDGGPEDLRTQQGLYHTRDVEMQEGVTAKIIFLDTRSYRDSHFIPSLGEIQLPLMPLIAAALRTTYSMLGFGREYAGDMLGDHQWEWLAHTLDDSEADFHIIVSSVQLFTTNPVVESWGHFPLAKARLLALLREKDPSGPVFLSGDVHHAELSAVDVVREDDEGGATDGGRRLVEVTSSGLTHTCRGGRVTKLLCPAMLHRFQDHRMSDDAFFMEKNFGMLLPVLSETTRTTEEDETREEADLTTPPQLDIKVLKLDTGDTVLQHRVTAHVRGQPRAAIREIRDHPFPYAPVEVAFLYSCALGVAVLLLRLVLRAAHGRKKTLAKED